MTKETIRKKLMEPTLASIPIDSRTGTDVESFKRAFQNHLHFTLAKDKYSATPRDLYFALAHTLRDHLIGRWIQTQHDYADRDPKRVYYISLEFLVGRTLGNSLINLDYYETVDQALQELNIRLEDLREEEWDAGLGNGGLGRLAACFLDSMATLGIPAYGYGLRYEYGIFYQKIVNGFQEETPDNWMRYGNPWEVGRPEDLFPVHFYGRVESYRDDNGNERRRWVDTEEIMAMAYDTPVPGYKNDVVNTMRLWAAKSSRGFDLEYFNHGDYVRAVEDKDHTENITRVLYPNDNQYQGKELRLKQEYFLVCATLQDIVHRYKEAHTGFDEFTDKVAIQLNDTHPSLAVPELMRYFLDNEKMEWDRAWKLVQGTFSYTNHTILPEALEQWPVSMLEIVLPRHLEIIYEINRRFLETLPASTTNEERSAMSIIGEGGEKTVRMANLSVVSSHKVNGVSELHTDLVKSQLFPEYCKLDPEKFIPLTNGITPRRWLKKANPGLAGLISSYIGDAWVTDLSELKKLAPLVDDTKFRNQWARVKTANKKFFAEYLRKTQGVTIDPNSIYSLQIKRIHEYKRQLLNILYTIHHYNRIKANPNRSTPWVPRTVMIGGKAAPGYYMAKLIIKLANAVGEKINNDPVTKDKLKLVFLENYRVSLAEKVIPAADLSEQISMAGMEASGTGNMKLSLNGALTIGTLDGANIEIMEEVGEENIFIFGHTTEELKQLRETGYYPLTYINSNPELANVLEMIRNGSFSPNQPDLFRPILEGLIEGGDYYSVLADFQPYIDAQDRVGTAFADQEGWIRKSILNVANMGKFSSDRTISNYANQVWGVPTNRT